MQTTRPHCRPFTRWVNRQAILVFIFTAAVILIGGCATVEEVTQRDKELCIERGSALDTPEYDKCRREQKLRRVSPHRRLNRTPPG